MNIEETLYDHYKDTCEIVRQEVSRRWHLTLTIVVVMLFLALLIVDESEGASLITGYLKNQFGSDIVIKFQYINTVMLYAYMIVVMTYYQKNIQIERLYANIHKIEAKLSQNGSIGIAREGEEYLHCYPFMLGLVDRIYKCLFPILISFVAIYKVAVENICGIFWMDLTAVVLIVALSILYVSYMCFNEKYLHKEHKDMEFWVRIKKYIKE